MSDYKIQLGIDFTGDKELNNIKKQLTNLTDNTHRVRIDIDNSRLLKQIEHAKKELKELSSAKGNQPSLTVNSKALEDSLGRLEKLIEGIKLSLGSLDNNVNTKDLVSSINQMATALGKAESESDSLVKSLSVLSKKDFNFNFNFKAGNQNPAQLMTKYGQEVVRTAIPTLEKQILYLENTINQKSKSAIQNYFLKKYQDFGGKTFASNLRNESLFGVDSDNKKLTGNKQMLSAEKYIRELKEVASLNNIDLSGFNNEFSKTATEVINDTTKIQSGVKDIEEQVEKFKSIFGGIDAKGLKEVLSPIIDDVRKLGEFIDKLAKNNSIDNLTGSFNRLAGALEPLTKNLNLAKDILNTGFTNVDTGIKSTDIVPDSNEVVKSAQQTGQQIGETIAKSAQQSINLDDVIDKEVLGLMKEHGISGKKDSDAFKDIKQALIHYRNTLKGVNDDTVLNDGAFGSFSNVSDLRQAADVIDSHIRKSADNATESYKKLKEEIKATNKAAKDGAKITLPDGIKSVWGDEYSEKRKRLGSAFTAEKGHREFEDYINELNKNTGNIINAENALDMVDELYEKLEIAKGKTASLTDESSRQKQLNIDDIEKDVISSLNRIEDAEQKMAQSSTQSTNTIVQNEQRKQQEYEETLARHKQRLVEIDKTIDDYSGRMGSPDNSPSDLQGYMDSMDNLENEKIGILADIEKIETALQSFKKNEDIINSFKRSLENIGMSSDEIDAVADKISSLGVKIETLNQKQIKDDRLTVDISGVDEFGNAIKLTQQYDVATGRLIKTIDRVSTVQQKAGTSTNSFAKQQKNAVADLTNQINQLNRSAIDPNTSRPIKRTSHLESLESQYKKVASAIQKMENASDDNTFQEERNNVKRLISEYKSLTAEYKNAENTATSLRSKDINTAKATYASDLDVLISKMKTSGVYTSGFEKGADNLRSILSNATDTSGLNSFSNGLDKLEAGYKRATAAVNEFNRSEKVGINVSGLESKIADIQRISPEINQFEAEINGAKVTVQSLLSDLSKIKTQGDFSVVNSRFKAFADAAKAAGIAVTETVTKAKTINNIKFKLSDTGFNGFKQEVARAHTDAEKLEGAYNDLDAALDNLDTAMADVYSADQAGNVKKLVAANEKYESSLKQVYSQLKLYQQEEEKAYKNELLSQKKASLNNEMEIWLKDNTRAVKNYGEDIRKLQASLDGLDDKGVKLVGQQFKNITKQAQVMGKTGLTVFDKLKSKAKEYMTYLSAAELFMYAEQAFRSMFEQVKLIDSAMTELKKVTDETDAAYEKFLTNAASKSKEIGTTIDGLVSSTADFARLGYGFEDSQGLAEVANIYAVVGDEIEGVEGATESLISTIAAFKGEMNGMSNSDFAMRIIDVYNELGNKFAISSGGLGEALERSASSLAAANNSLYESAALITAANTVVQDPEAVGTAFKTKF